MPDLPWWVLVLLGILMVVAGITTVWSLAWDLRAYRVWKQGERGALSRAERRRRQRHPEEYDEDRRRWRRLMLALRLAAFCMVGGPVALVMGYVNRTAWLMVGGGNLVVFGVMLWVAYQIVLPKPRVLREKKLPGRMARG